LTDEIKISSNEVTYKKDFMSASLSELKAKLLALNVPENPFSVKEQGNKIIVGWNLVDAQWIEMFGKAGLKDAYQMIISFDEKKNVVKYLDQTGQIEWHGTVPQAKFSASFFRGKKFEMKKEMAAGLKTDGTVGQIYNISFNSNQIKEPIFKAIEEAGWKVDKSLGFPPLILLPLIIGAVLIVGGTVLKATQGLLDPINDQFAQLEKGNIPAAYADTSTQFQQATNLENFTQFVNEFPVVKTNPQRSFSEQIVQGETGSVVGKINSSDGKVYDVDYDLVKENNTWKILHLHLKLLSDSSGSTNSSPSPIEKSSTNTETDMVNPSPSSLTSPQPSIPNDAIITDISQWKKETPAFQYMSNKGSENTGKSVGNTIEEIKINDNFGSNKFVETSFHAFSPSLTALYVSTLIKIEKVSGATTLKATLYDDKTNQELISATLPISATGEEITNFRFTSKQGFPVGEYKITISFSTGEAADNYFSVRP
jgi:hypothetical protein